MQMQLCEGAPSYDFDGLNARADDAAYTFGPWLSAGPLDNRPEGAFQHVDADGCVWPVGWEWAFTPRGPCPEELTVAYRAATLRSK